MKQITTFHYKNRTYYICYTEGGEQKGYWAFEDKYVDANMRLTKQFNGANGHHNAEMAQTLIQVKNEVDLDEWDAANPNAEETARLFAIRDIVERNYKGN